MDNQTIKINVVLDEKKMCHQLEWSASGAEDPNRMKPAKGMFLSFWDPEENAAMRLDLWTKQMKVDEMADFFVQTMLTMGETFITATQDKELGEAIKKFAADFKKRADQKIAAGNPDPLAEE